MSLIVTSNINLGDRVEESQIHKPWSYHNRLNDVMKIPADSEVAVQSVKLNKNGLQSVDRYNSTFATYWGRPITGGGFPAGKTIFDTPFHPHITSLIDGDEGVEDLTTNEIAERLTRCLSNSNYCPHTIQHVSSATADVEADVLASVKTDANGKFQGYEIDQTFHTLGGARLVDAADLAAGKVQGQGVKDWDESGGQGVSWEYYTGAQTNLFMSMNTDERKNVGGAQVVLKDYPVSLNSTGWNDASCKVFIPFSNSVGAEWAVGLVRNNVVQYDPIDGQFLGWAPEESDIWWSERDDAKPEKEGWGRTHQFYDYVMCKRGSKLRIYHAVVSSNRAPRNRGNRYNLVMKEIPYWENIGSPLGGQDAYDLDVNNIGIEYVGWVVDGDCVEPWFAGNNQANPQKIWSNDVIGTTKDLTSKPRGDLNNNLYVKLYVMKQFDNLTIYHRNVPGNLFSWNADNPNADWVVRLRDEGNYLNWGREVETRNIMDYNPLYDTSTWKYHYGRTDAQSLIIDNYKPVLILEPTEQYIRNFTQMCNSAQSLGFGGRSLQDTPVMTTPNNNSLATFTSTEVPLLTSQKSLFVKLTNFTHSSANAKRGQNHSKIMAHLPRFDNAGNEVGGLYFEPHERVYVALNNPAELNINEFDVEIVYDDESYADCIGGKTIVCFHIRPRLYREIK